MYLSQEASSNKFTEDDFWFGANDLYSPQKWTWMDNTPFDFEDWDKGQPEDTSGSDCGAVLMQGGRWRAVDCFLQKPYVCTISALDAPSTIGLTTTTTVSPTTTSSTSMVPSTKRTTTSKPKSCPVSWTYYDTTGFCYVVLQGETWINAENRCQFENGHLASIHNLDEDLFLAHIAGGSYAWIGLFTDDNNAHWKWTDGTPFNYTNWRAGEPNKPGVENYVTLLSDATLNNWDGNHASSFICKRLPS
uniref:C-type lectin domain-containing protein n=1 Tax=Panagrolaimus sp. PS1159 TaxID=55785 RepID=A0AC35EWB2_9BILA